MRLNTNVTSIIYLAIFILGLFTHEYVVASQRLVYENFDSGSWGVLGHGSTGGDANGTSLATENSHSGSRSAKVDYSGGNNLNHIWYDGLQNSIGRELYISFWFYHHPNWKFHYNHKLMRLTNSVNTFNTNHEFLASDTFHSDGSMLVTPSTDCGYKDNSWYSAKAGTREAGKWHHLEFYGKLNTNGNRDGIFRLWIDGEQVANSTSWSWVDPGCDPQSATYKWGTAYFPSNYADVPPSGSTPIYYIDDVEIWDEHSS